MMQYDIKKELNEPYWYGREVYQQRGAAKLAATIHRVFIKGSWREQNLPFGGSQITGDPIGHYE